MEVMTRNKLSDRQVLDDYFSNRITDEDLTGHQKERIKRIRLCVSMMLEGRPKKQIAKKLGKLFEVSESTAYLDLRITTFIFSKLLRSDKEMYRAMAIEMALEDRRAAIKAGDNRSRNAATKNFIDASGIKNEDPDLPDFGKLQPAIIVPLHAPGLEVKVDALLIQGAVDLNDLPDTIDIPHEEIDTGAGGPAEKED